MSINFTDDSVIIRNYMFPKMETYNTTVLKKLYNHLNGINLKNITILSYSDHKINRAKINSTFVSNKIKTHIETKLNKKSVCKIVIDNLAITINIYYQNDNISQFLYILINYIRFISSMVDDISINELEINYYLTNYKKLLNKNIILSKDQVNSGSCFINEKGFAMINIWRKEEIFKVTLHELIHAFGFSNYDDTDELIAHFNNKYNIKSKIINSNEAYTEIWANILNCYLISQISQKKSLDFFTIMLSLERSYSIYLAQKILHKIKGINNPDINKKTNVLAYYIIRAEIYENLSKFIKNCSIENENYIKIIKRDGIIKYMMNNNKIKQNRIFNSLSLNNFTYKTLRMSLNELDPFMHE